MGGSTVSIDDLGQDDFQDKYLDEVSIRNSGNVDEARHHRPTPGDFDSDQVHHFAAYLSMGINGMALVSWAHELGDKNDGNHGDVDLGNDAYAVGSELRQHPDRLWDIERWTKAFICK